MGLFSHWTGCSPVFLEAQSFPTRTLPCVTAADVYVRSPEFILHCSHLSSAIFFFCLFVVFYERFPLLYLPIFLLIFKILNYYILNCQSCFLLSGCYFHCDIPFCFVDTMSHPALIILMF